jgi:signal transduction histidine kinase/CheY-like chemotaxis protein
MDAHLQKHYRVETRRLVARRGLVGTAIFVGGVGLAAVLEYGYNPERLFYLSVSFAVEILICLATLACFRSRRLRRYGVEIVLGAAVAILLCISLYGRVARANPDALAFLFIVFELAVALLFPWGARDQAFLAIAAALFYGCSIYDTLIGGGAGVVQTPPVVYGLYAVTAAGVLSVLGAAFLNRQRFSLFAQREQLDQHLATFRDLTRTFDEFDPQRVVFLSCVLTLETFHLRRLWVVWQALGSGEVLGYVVSRDGKGVRWNALADTQPLWSWASRWKTTGAAFIGSGTDPDLPASLRCAAVTSLLCIPIGSEGERFGTICADREGEPLEIGDRQLALASVLASGTAIAMANARLYQQVAAASDEKSLLLARIAHELRNPLQAMLWDLDAVEEAPRMTPEQLERLRQNALMTIAMAKELQEFAEVETRRLTASHEPVNLAQTIDNLRVMAAASLERRPIALVTRVAADAEVIVTDPFRLRQILGNLIANAAKFTTRGTIDIEAHRAGTEIAISVRDTGAGIEATDLAGIFKPFYRGSARAHAGTRGMGLGLAIAREIATLLGGRIEVESVLGCGSTFRVLLPANGVATDSAAALGAVPDNAGTDSAAADGTTAERRAADRATAVNTVGQRPPAVPGAVVLLIEDDESYRDRVAQALRSGGTRVVEAREGAEGLRCARERRPDVVVLDLGLPGLGGLEVLDELRRDPLLADVPVVVATAEADPRVAAQCRAAGCAAYVVKPYTPEELLDVLAPLLARTEPAPRPASADAAN